MTPVKLLETKSRTQLELEIESLKKENQKLKDEQKSCLAKTRIQQTTTILSARPQEPIKSPPGEKGATVIASSPSSNPEAFVFCPICKHEVKRRNLQRHTRKKHPSLEQKPVTPKRHPAKAATPQRIKGNPAKRKARGKAARAGNRVIFRLFQGGLPGSGKRS